MSPRPRRSIASTPAARATADGLRSRIAAASAMLTSRPSAKQSASSAGARSSGSASDVPSGTAARPKTSRTRSSSTTGHRDRAERVALLDGRFSALEHLEQGEKAGHGLEPGADPCEHLLEFEGSGCEAFAEQPDLVLHRERDRHGERLGVAEAFEDSAEGRRQALWRDSEALHRDDLG